MNTNLHDVEAFLAQAPWLRRLALRLAEPADAEDLMQETWAKLAASPPQHADAPRGWLAAVLRNARKMQLRGRERRSLRETSSSTPEPLPDAETLLARAQQFRALTRAVEALEEPFRRTVLLHFFEGISLAEIARREDRPSATVRARLRTGLFRLRGALDNAHDGDRAAWLPAFAALRPAALAMKTTTKLALAFGALAAATVTAVASGSSVPPHQDAAQTHAVEPEGSASRAQSADPETAVPPSATAKPERKPRAATSTLPRPDINLARFGDAPGRDSKRDAIQRARLTRLSEAGLPEDLVRDAGTDIKLLGDIEQMMMSEDASTIGTACLEASPPAQPDVYTFSVAFEGEPDVGTIITDVTSKDERDDDAFTTCVRESLYMLSISPPAEGGTQVLEVFFDTDADPLITGVQQPQ